MKTAQLWAEIKHLVTSGENKKTFMFNVMSFGYKKGIPLAADMVFDMRFIPNPYYVKSLRPLTGNNAKVSQYVLKHEVTLAMEHELPMTVAIIDIDHFKGINDNWGHMVGDRAIKHVAELLSDNIRSSDYIFRYGGEEFLLVLVETGVSEAFTILDRLRKKISQLAFNVGGDTQIPITASIGYAVHSGHPDYNLLLRDADNALYAAKREGRNCVKMHKGRV